VQRPRPGRPEAAAAIWPWRQAAGPAPLTGNPARLRLIGSLQALAIALAGLALLRFWIKPAGVIALCISGVILVSALASPTGLYAGVRRFFIGLGHLTGRLLTWVLMPLLFYLLFLPFGRVFRRGRRDRLRRFFEPEATSYWEPHRGPTASSSSRERLY
jgi:hypothetical protein